jgi:uncharacterized protein
MAHFDRRDKAHGKRGLAEARGRSLDTILALEDRLPLTCTRAGACCRGKAIWLNPWEVACLARARRLSPRELRDRDTTDGGIRLRLGEEEPSLCSQYDPARGCVAHDGRPLACRLFPLGRRREGSSLRYMHPGAIFPCLDGCPEVRDLPCLTVAEYLEGQHTGGGEVAQDAYLEVTLDLAESALALFLEGGLAASGDRDTLPRWRSLGAMPDADRAVTLPRDWFDALTVPPIEAPLGDPAAFVQEHRGLLQARLEEVSRALGTGAELRELCGRTMALSLHLGRSIGTDPRDLAARWIAAAERHGGNTR